MAEEREGFPLTCRPWGKGLQLSALIHPRCCLQPRRGLLNEILESCRFQELPCLPVPGPPWSQQRLGTPEGQTEVTEETDQPDRGAGEDAWAGVEVRGPPPHLCESIFSAWWGMCGCEGHGLKGFRPQVVIVLKKSRAERLPGWHSKEGGEEKKKQQQQQRKERGGEKVPRAGAGGPEEVNPRLPHPRGCCCFIQMFSRRVSSS